MVGLVGVYLGKKDVKIGQENYCVCIYLQKYFVVQEEQEPKLFIHSNESNHERIRNTKKD